MNFKEEKYSDENVDTFKIQKSIKHLYFIATKVPRLCTLTKQFASLTRSEK